MVPGDLNIRQSAHTKPCHAGHQVETSDVITLRYGTVAVGKSPHVVVERVVALSGSQI